MLVKRAQYILQDGWGNNQRGGSASDEHPERQYGRRQTQAEIELKDETRQQSLDFIT
jgi:hypothetical protein